MVPTKVRSAQTSAPKKRLFSPASADSAHLLEAFLDTTQSSAYLIRNEAAAYAECASGALRDRQKMVGAVFPLVAIGPTDLEPRFQVCPKALEALVPVT